MLIRFCSTLNVNVIVILAASSPLYALGLRLLRPPAFVLRRCQKEISNSNGGVPHGERWVIGRV